MRNRNKDFDSEAWSDFTHSRASSALSNEQVFDRFRAFLRLYRTLPKKELIERGWLESADDASLIAQLFFALNGDQSNALFRKSASADESLLEMWLSLVRVNAEYACIEQDMPRFRSLAKDDLKSIARLSVDVDAVRTLPTRLATRGIVLIYFRGLTGMKIDGAAFRLFSGHMVIGMSLRFPRLDYFWFTLMHELAHLVLHASALDKPRIVDIELESSHIDEKAANRLAKESFVDKISWRNCEPKYQSGDDAVMKYARQQGIHPSIVAGLLRREFNNYTRYSKIINQYNVREIIFGQ